MPPETIGFMIGSSLIGGVVGLALTLVIGGLLGAPGGAVGVALFKEISKPT